ncbi:3-oxoacyl-ACP reductase FabG [Pigmentiphaga soli]|uniref:3-oxoacyl-ACP reductase FabG n=1 Tax=Pigmentiphaga soli TaxID=1007095 RepID=A0ABP8HSA4_9BURK
MPPLTDKIAIVTGASLPNGIGVAIARRLAQAGAGVLLVAEGTEEQLRARCDECRQAAPGARVEYGLFDLAAPGGAEGMVEHAAQRFGRVDILVNNAALRVSKDFGDYTRDDFDKVVAVNLAAPFFASQSVVPLMRRQGGGRIIHVASQLGKVALEQRALYGLTKAGVIHLAKSMACELGRDGIIVNSISPGPVNTQRAIDRMRADPALHRQLEADIPLGRSGSPEEIADVALFLATTAAAFLQGEDICVDGGYTAH